MSWANARKSGIWYVPPPSHIFADVFVRHLAGGHRFGWRRWWGGGKGGREGGRELDVICFDGLCVVFFVMCDVGLLVCTVSTLNKQVRPKILTEVPCLRRWRANTVRHPVLYVPSQCLFTSVVLCFCDV